MLKANIGDIAIYHSSSSPDANYYVYEVVGLKVGYLKLRQFMPFNDNVTFDMPIHVSDSSEWVIGKRTFTFNANMAGKLIVRGEIQPEHQSKSKYPPYTFVGLWNGQFSENMTTASNVFEGNPKLDPCDPVQCPECSQEFGHFGDCQPATAIYSTREEWLNAALGLVIMDASMLFQVPDKIRVSTGFPSTRATSVKSTSIGQCWKPSASNDQTTEIFVSPILSQPEEVLAVLVHELGHAINFMSGHEGHGKEFRAYAKGIGLTGPMTNTVPNATLSTRLQEFAQMLGPYPHASLNPLGSGRTKAKTRLLKAYCPDCNTIMRVTAAHIQPDLPICWKKACTRYQQEMTVEIPPNAEQEQ